jgi:hypothetical protein
MHLSPSSEAASCAATKEFPNILKNSKAHYRGQLDRNSTGNCQLLTEHLLSRNYQ